MPHSSKGSVSTHPASLLSFLTFLVLLPSTVAATDLTPGRHVLHGKSVQICNAVGEATIVAGDGNDVVVEVAPHGADAAKLRVVIEDCRGQKVLRVVYPSNRIVDPEMGRYDMRETSFDGCCGPGRIHFVRPGDGLDARADLTIHVPKDQKLGLSLAAGRVDVTGVRMDLALDTGSGDIHVRDTVGAISIDSGSGRIAIEKAKGTIAIDSGSGAVRIDEFDGTLAIDSGSGGVTVSNLRTDKVAIDSGSGEVSGENVVAGALVVDSGSGSIEFTRITAPEIVFDSGSGAVSAGLARSPKSLRIESSSGGVDVTAPRNLDAMLEISCPKRRLDLGFPVAASRSSDYHFEGRVGAGNGLIVIDSGSGRVTLRAEED